MFSIRIEKTNVNKGYYDSTCITSGCGLTSFHLGISGGGEGSLSGLSRVRITHAGCASASVTQRWTNWNEDSSIKRRYFKNLILESPFRKAVLVSLKSIIKKPLKKQTGLKVTKTVQKNLKIVSKKETALNAHLCCEFNICQTKKGKLCHTAAAVLFVFFRFPLVFFAVFAVYLRCLWHVNTIPAGQMVARNVLYKI